MCHKTVAVCALAIALGVWTSACADDAPPHGQDPGPRASSAVAGVGGIRLPKRLALAEDAVAVAAFPNLGFTNPTDMFVRDGYVYVAEQRGRVYRFTDDPDVRTKTLVLDLSSHTQDGNDGGLLAIAPHPDFAPASDVEDVPSRRHLYVYYLHNDMPAPRDDVKHGQDTWARLSRFTVGDDGTADPAREQVLIDQFDRHIWHQGGGMFFHPADGFLYLAIGDEGGRDCRYENCQRTDQALFGGVLRIDVDERGGAISHPIRQTPRDAFTEHYFIPSDNPFVDEPGVLEEFYAIGLRSPHRMTYDPVDGLAWIGDVGQSLMEEVDVLAPGANYQWDIMEGTMVSDAPWDPTIARPGVWTDPVRAFSGGQVDCLIGGPVYRGRQLPDLYGRYLFADWSTGGIFAATYDARDGQVTWLGEEQIVTTPFVDRENGISGFGQGPEGRVYFLTLGDDDEGSVQALAPAVDLQDTVPERLSETGLFADLATLQPAAPFVPYAVNVPLWSDGTRKRRWVALPDGATVDWTDGGALDLPDGTVFLKHFEMPTDAGHPEQALRLETRVVVLTEEGLYGLSYRWNQAQDDAEVVLSRAQQRIEVVDADGNRDEFTYDFPSPGDCLQCHAPRGPRSLGFVPRQLLRKGGGGILASMRDEGTLLSAPGDSAWGRVPRLPAVDDESLPLEDRVRAYLDVNCAHCHGARRAGDTAWDARMATPLDEQGIVMGALTGRRGFPEDHRLVVPGDPERSVLSLRVASDDPALRMPPLATNRPDTGFATLLERWIESLEAAP